MKTLELKTKEMVVLGSKSEFSYKDMLQVIMENPQDQQKGAGIDEIRKSIRVLEALEKSSGILELEDSDYSFMLAKVKATKFTSANRVFLDFVDDVEKAGNNVEEKA